MGLIVVSCRCLLSNSLSNRLPPALCKSAPQSWLPAGSRYHRPAEHTHTSSGRNLQSLSLLAGGSSSGAKGKAAPPPEPAVELLEDDNDEFCHICGLGVR